MRKAALAAVSAIVAGGAIYYGLFVVPTHQFRDSLNAAIAKLSPAYSVHYGGAHYSLLAHTAELSYISIQGTGDSPVSATIAKLSVERPALDLQDSWDRAAANPTALKPEQGLPVADRIAIQGAKIQSAIGSGSIESASIDKLRIYPWALLHPGVPALKDLPAMLTAMTAQQRALQQTVQQQQEQADPSALQNIQQLQKQQLETILPIFRVEASLVLGIGFDGFNSDNMDMVFAQPAIGTMPAGNLHAAIRKFREGALDRGLGGDSSFEGLTEDLGGNFKFSADHGVNTRLAFRDPAMRLLNGEPFSLASLNGLALDRLEMDGISATTPTGGSAEIQGISASGLAFDHGFLKSAAFGMTGFKQSVANLPDPRSKAMFQQIGLNTITLSMSAAFQWDPDKKTASFHDVGLKIDELGSLRVTADLANIDPATPTSGNQVSLVGGTIRYDDASLIDRLLGAGGTPSKEQILQMRQQFAAGFLQNIATANPDAKIAASSKAVSDFATSPHSLTISLTPPKPIPLPDFQTIAAAGLPNLINVLGLSVTSNQ